MGLYLSISVPGASQCLLSTVVTALCVTEAGLKHEVFSCFHAFYLPGEPCLTVRAYHRIQELQQLLEIAYSNYRQLGGITEEERKMKKHEKEVEK